MVDILLGHERRFKDIPGCFFVKCANALTNSAIQKKIFVKIGKPGFFYNVVDQYGKKSRCKKDEKVRTISITF